MLRNRINIIKIYRNLSRRQRLAILGILIVLLGGFVFASFVLRKNAEAGWSPNHASWTKRKQLTLTNNSAGNLSQYTTVAVTVDTKSLVDQGKLQSDCDDLRVLYQPNSTTFTELSRSVSYAGGTTCSTSEATKVYFSLQAALNSGSSSALYYMYYGNGQASAPSNPDNAYDINTVDALLVCPFDGSTTCAASETPSTATGAIRYSGTNTALSVGAVGNNDYVSVADSASLDGISKEITIEAWVKPFNNPEQSPLDGSVWQQTYIFGRSITESGGGCSSTFANGLGQHYSGFFITLTLNGCAYGTDVDLAPYNLNQTYHVAGTYDGQTMRIFVDGVLKDSVAASGTINNNNQTWYIRSGHPSNVVGSDAVIDELRVSNVARYTSNFTPQTTPFTRDEHTVALYHFDENGDDPRNIGKVIDDTGNDNDGTITGSTQYVAGLVGIDGSSSSSPQFRGNAAGGNTYSGHEGIFIEESTTNKITNPSFENATYNQNWTASGGTASDNTTAPLYKFGSHSYKLVLSTTTNQTVLTSINPGNTNTHTLSAYVYRGTPANYGSTVDSTVAQLVFRGTAQTTTYTNVGGGWWRLSYAAAAANAAENYGVQVNEDSGTLYIDGVQLEEKAYATTYTDGTLGTGYSWSGTAHDSTSTRTLSDLRYVSSGNISKTAGTFSAWIKFPHGEGALTNQRYYIMDTLVSSGGFQGYRIFYDPTLNRFELRKFVNGTEYQARTSYTPGVNQWVHIAATWDTTNGGVMYVNTTIGSLSISNLEEPGTLNSTLFIGNDFTPIDDGSGDMAISDLRIFDTALTSTQVTDLYYAGLTAHSDGIEVDRFSDNKNQNPVAIYHFDESSGTTASDSSTYGNNLTLYGPTWETQSVGARARLTRNLKFDGTNDIASRSGALSRNFNFGTDNFSVSGWFRHSSTISGTDTIVAKYNTAGYKIYMNSSGYLCFGIDDDSTFDDDVPCSGATPGSFADSKWHHFEAVRDTSSLTLYVDGYSVATDTSLAAAGTLNNNSGVFIGSDSNNSNYWDGYLDELVFYPYARDSSQVKEDYLGNQTAVLYGSQAFDPLTQGLVGYWKMDEADWGTPNCSTDVAFDSSGNSFNADACPATTGPTGGENGKFGNGITLDNSNDYLQIADNTTIRFDSSTQDFSLFAWIKRAGTGEADIIYQKWDGASDGYKLEFRTTNTLRCGINANTFTSTNTITDTNWHHVGCVLDRDGNGQIFIDGLPDGTPQPVNSEAMATTASLMLGADNGGGSNFNGTLDEARIYNRALSPAEVANLYNWAPGPVIYLPLDENNGQSAYDKSGNNLDGILGDTTGSGSDDPSWTNGKVGGGLLFDGTNDRVEIADNDLLDITTNLTVTAWVRLSSDTSNVKQFVRKDNSAYGYWFEISGTETVEAGGASTGSIITTTSLNINTWYHLAYVFDGNADTQSIYIDGALSASETGQTGTFQAGTDQLDIGVYDAGTDSFSQWFPGNIDDVKIYNYARTSGQIVEDMNAGHPAPGSPVGSPLGWWKFDEGYGDTAYDSGFGGNNGDLAHTDAVCPQSGDSGCPTWTNSGKFGKALEFDVAGTTDDYVKISDTPELDFGDTDDFTISAWINVDDYSATRTIVDKKNGNSSANAGYLLNVFQGNILLYVSDGTDQIFVSTTPIVISTGAWYHIVAVWDQDSQSNTTIYINGKDSKNTFSGTIANVDSIANANAFAIGAQAAENVNFDGKIDEVKLYNQALTPDQIKVEYNEGSSSVWGATSTDSSGNATWSSINQYCPPGQGSVCTGPTGEWKFDENTGTSAYDTSGNNRTGTLSGGPVWDRGKISSGIKFDGTNDLVTTNTIVNNFITDSAGTLEAWAYFTGPAGSCEGNSKSQCPGVIGDSGGYFGITRGIEDGVDRLWFFNVNNPTEDFVPGIAYTTDTWYHLGWVHSGGNIYAYVNGVLKGSTASGNTLDVVTQDLQIGRLDVGYHSGLIDNVRVYNYARTPAQIAWDYNRGAPVAHYKFDETSWTNNCSTDTVFDSSPNAFHGDSCPNGTGQTTPESGKLNNAIHFDGSNDYINLGNNFHYDLPISFAAWVKLDSNSIVQSIIATDKTGNTNHTGAWLDVTTSGKIDVGYADNTGCTTSDLRRKTGTTTLSTDVWYHVAGVIRGATDMDLYVNGKDDGGTYDGTGGTIAYTSASAAIGKIDNCASGDFFYDGLVDNAKIWNYDITAEQVKTEFNDGALRFGPESGNP